MKALIISDESEVSEKLKNFFKAYGIDIISYKWLLKALDNIEEIQPDIILLSASEYPRHWKTLVQFVKSGIGGDEVKVYLYEPNPLSKEDEEKAKSLGVTGYFTSLDSQYLKSVFSFLEDISKNQIIEDYQEEEEDELPTVSAILSNFGYVLITNPIHKDFVSGKVTSFNNNRIEATLDFDLIDVSNNDIIDCVSYFNEEECYSFSAEIFILNPENKTVILTIKEKYEE
ncbi:MAG: response regulator [Treponema sp.]|nr:response regulator [Treponema sp.]